MKLEVKPQDYLSAILPLVWQPNATNWLASVLEFKFYQTGYSVRPFFGKQKVWVKFPSAFNSTVVKENVKLTDVGNHRQGLAAAFESLFGGSSFAQIGEASLRINEARQIIEQVMQSGGVAIAAAVQGLQAKGVLIDTSYDIPNAQIKISLRYAVVGSIPMSLNFSVSTIPLKVPTNEVLSGLTGKSVTNFSGAAKQPKPTTPPAPTFTPDAEVPIAGPGAAVGVHTKEPNGEWTKALKATWIGQKCKGTSPGTEYRVVAIAKDMAIACRQQGASLSIRIEWSKTPKPEVLNEIKELGFEIKGDYASNHFKVMGSTVHRVLGAVLNSLSVDFTKKVTSKKETSLAFQK